MSSRVNHWKLGMFVLLGIAAGIGFLTWLGLQRLERETYTAYAYFDESVHGLSTGSTVEFRGVKIGQVSDITVARDKRHVKVQAALFVNRMEALGFDPANLEREGLLPQGLGVQLISNPLTGTSYILADFFREEVLKPPDYSFEVERNTIRSVPSTFKSLEANLFDTLNAIPPLANEATSLLERLNGELEGMDLTGLTAEARSLIESLRRKVDGIERLAVVEEAKAAFEQAKDMSAEIRRLVEEWYSPEGPFKTVARDYRDLAKRIQRAIDEMEVGATAAALRAAGGEAAGLGRDLRAQIASLRRTLDAVEGLAVMLERDPGALLRGKSVQQRPGRDN